MAEKLSFDWFVAKIHEVFDRFPDYRKFSPNLRYSVKEAVLGAFMFFSQSPSFLAYQKAMQQAHGRNNAQSFLASSSSVAPQLTVVMLPLPLLVAVSAWVDVLGAWMQPKGAGGP